MISKAPAAATSPELQTYCTIAIRQAAITSRDEKAPWVTPEMGPKHNRSVKTVMNVAITMLAELNAIVSFFLVMRKDETKPSSPANRIADSPSNNISDRKMKMSDTEIQESKRKKRTVMREPTNSVTAVSNRYGRPSSCIGKAEQV